MASKVYFANLRARNPRENKANKVQRLFEAAGFEDLIKEGDLTAIKLHAAHPALKDGVFVTLRVPEVINITPDCDGLPWSDSSIVPDIGILASTDPVALDAASYDLVKEAQGFKESALKSHFEQGEDKFKGGLGTGR